MYMIREAAFNFCPSVVTTKNYNYNYNGSFVDLTNEAPLRLLCGHLSFPRNRNLDITPGRVFVVPTLFSCHDGHLLLYFSTDKVR